MSETKYYRADIGPLSFLVEAPSLGAAKRYAITEQVKVRKATQHECVQFAADGLPMFKVEG